jgi:hypothetical protein
MGGIHPRPKQTVGRRLALAARAVAYKKAPEVAYTGPVLKNCSLAPVNQRCIDGKCAADGFDSGHFGSFRQLTINFDEDLLRSDAVKVWAEPSVTQTLAQTWYWNCLNATCMQECGRNSTCINTHNGCRINSFVCSTGFSAPQIGPRGNGYLFFGNQHLVEKTGKPLSPLEVQVNHTIWLPVSINAEGPQDSLTPSHWNCQPNPKDPSVPTCVNGSRGVNWASLTAMVAAALPLGCSGEPFEGGAGRCPPAEELRNSGRYCISIGSSSSSGRYYMPVGAAC